MTATKILALSLAGVLALPLIGCTSQDEQTVLNDVEQVCQATPVVVDIASGIPGASGVSYAIGAGMALACDQGLALVAAAIDAINGQGGTATVTLTAQPQSTAAKTLVRKMKAKYGARLGVAASSNVITFVLPPSPLPF